MEKLFSVLASPIPYLLLISVVIAVHELGHYLAGRMFNAGAESFSIGFGRSILETTDKRGTRWRLNWMPLGGFVKFVGEMQAPTDNTSDKPALVGRSFLDLNPWERLVIALGGPFANFVFAVVVFILLAMTVGVPMAREVRVNQVVAGGVAESAGFKVGDVVVRADGSPVRVSSDVIRATAFKAGEPVTYGIRRGGETMDIVAVPRSQQVANQMLNVEEKVGRIGLGLNDVDFDVQRLGPVGATAYGFEQLSSAMGSTVTVLRRLVSGREGLEKLSGPLGILNITDKVTDGHLKHEEIPLERRIKGLMLDMVSLAALLSIGVGFFNLFPIPMLDGGTAVTCIAEGLMRRSVPETVQRAGLTIGLVFLVSFAVLISWNDLVRLKPLETLRELGVKAQD